MRIRVENDLFGIADRLRGIDRDYTVYYDKAKGLFELHNLRSRPSLQLVFPYGSLDKRAVDYALKTRTHIILGELKAIEEYNESLASRQEKRLADEAERKLESAIAYLGRGGRELPEYAEL